MSVESGAGQAYSPNREGISWLGTKRPVITNSSSLCATIKCLNIAMQIQPHSFMQLNRIDLHHSLRQLSRTQTLKKCGQSRDNRTTPLYRQLYICVSDECASLCGNCKWYPMSGLKSVFNIALTNMSHSSYVTAHFSFAPVRLWYMFAKSCGLVHDNQSPLLLKCWGLVRKGQRWFVVRSSSAIKWNVEKKFPHICRTASEARHGILSCSFQTDNGWGDLFRNWGVWTGWPLEKKSLTESR